MFRFTTRSRPGSMPSLPSPSCTGSSTETARTCACGPAAVPPPGVPRAAQPRHGPAGL